MNIIAVDDERRALKLTQKAIALAAPEASVHGFVSAEAALTYARDHRVDVAFLDIMMGEMDGLTLAKCMKEIHGATNIVFVTGYRQYADSAFELHASGYLLKPVSPERVKAELGNLRCPVAAQAVAHIRVQCFGAFAVFVDGVPLVFPRAKPRELLAYLVHRNGAPATNAQIASVLWEDRPNSLSVQSNTRNVIVQLMRLLKEAGIGEILIKARNSMAINVARISCDYYDYLCGDARAVNAFGGEYMSDYSWAEFTSAYLDNR